MDKIKIISDFLIELRHASRLIKSEESFRATMRKYDMLFLGEKFNTVYAREMQLSLENVFRISISMPEVLEIIPGVCNSLGMEIDAMTFVGDPERQTSDYQITLY